MDEVWDAYDFEGAPGEVIALDGPDDYGDDGCEYDCEYDGDAGSGDDAAVEAPAGKAVKRKGTLPEERSATDGGEDVDEPLEAEGPDDKVGQRLLLGAWAAAEEEEDVDEDLLEEFPKAEATAAAAGDEGEERHDDDDLYADLLEFTRAPVGTKGREGDRLFAFAVGTGADEEEDVDEDLRDEFPKAEATAAPAGDEGEDMPDDDDLYADLEEFMRPPDVAGGQEEGEGGGAGDDTLADDLEKYATEGAAAEGEREKKRKKRSGGPRRRLYEGRAGW
jgi:hypothetical protein